MNIILHLLLLSFFWFMHPLHFPFLIKSVFIKMIILHTHFTKQTHKYAMQLPLYSLATFVVAQRDRAAFFNMFSMGNQSCKMVFEKRNAVCFSLGYITKTLSLKSQIHISVLKSLHKSEKLLIIFKVLNFKVLKFKLV